MSIKLACNVVLKCFIGLRYSQIADINKLVEKCPVVIQKHK